jgi:hypothetical protein
MSVHRTHVQNFIKVKKGRNEKILMRGVRNGNPNDVLQERWHC